MTKDRKYRELGAKIYEGLLHICAISGLIMAADGLEYLKPFGIVIRGLDDSWWVWLIITAYVIFKLAVLIKLKKIANKKGMLLTELTDEIQKKRKR